MKRSIYFLMIAGISTLLLISCKNNAPKETKLIPKEALAVLTIDPNTLKDKLQDGGISIDTILGKIFEKDTTDIADRKKVEDFRLNAGINWKEKIHFFAFQKKGVDAVDVNIMNVLGSVESEEKLKAYLAANKSFSKNSIQQQKEFSYLLLENNSMLAWNKNYLMVMFYSENLKPTYDTVNMRFIIPEKRSNEKNMLVEMTQLFTQKESASMASVKGFSDMFKTKAEGYIFASTNNLTSLTAMPLQLPKLEEIVKDNYTAATLAFEEGKIIATATTYTNPLLSSILKKYAGPTVNISLIENYPSQNINSIFLASFDPALFGGILKQLEVEGLLNEFLKKTGMSSADFYGSLKGDIAVVVSDLGVGTNEPQNRKDELSLTMKKHVAKMIMNIPIGNQQSFTKVMGKAVERGFVVKNGATYKGGELMNAIGLYMMADNNNLIIASDSLTYQQYIKKSATATINKEARDYFKGKSTAFYIDIANTLNGFSKDSTNGFHGSMLSAKNTIKDILGSSENFSGNSIKSVVEVRMQNEQQNSLVTLMSLFTNIAVDVRAQAKRERENEEKMLPSGIPAVIRAN